MPRFDQVVFAVFDMIDIITSLVRGILGRVIGYVGLSFGFWLLYRAFLSSDLLSGLGFGICGSLSILVSLYVLIWIRRVSRNWIPSERINIETEVQDDSLDRSGSRD